jgi:hypothetical protein
MLKIIFTIIRTTATIRTKNKQVISESQDTDITNPMLGWVIPHFQVQNQQAAVSHILEGLGKFTQRLHDLLGHWRQVHVHMALLSRRKH